MRHVETGLRTYDRFNPFIEEINRRMAGVLAECYFATAEKAKQYLIMEGLKEDKVFVTGNTPID